MIAAKIDIIAFRDGVNNFLEVQKALTVNG